MNNAQKTKVTDSHDQPLNQMESAIINTLLYSGIFNYPLTEIELIRMIQVKIADDTVFKEAIESLFIKKLIYRINGFILLQSDENLVNRRLMANRNTKRYLPVAFKFSNLLYRFPFVRGVCLSGSISKNNFTDGNDIDFFIISEQKRIWLLNLMVTLFRKTLTRHRRYFFCINYFIEKGNSIHPMNLFTANELVSLVPTAGIRTCHDFIRQNNWTSQYFPNMNNHEEYKVAEEPVFYLKRFIEFICGNKLFDFLNYVIMRLMVTRIQWMIKTGRMNVPDQHSFFSTVNNRMIRMNHICDNQSRILRLLEMARRQFENVHNIRFYHESE